jgi:Family of unknown function (DUF6444)
MVDWRDARIAELERQLAERDAQLAELERRLAHLEELLRRSSKNSSKPPSSDGPKKTKRPHWPTGLKPGGQPGHPKHERPLAPPDKVNERVVVKPPSCEWCARPVRKRRRAPPPSRLGVAADLGIRRHFPVSTEGARGTVPGPMFASPADAHRRPAEPRLDCLRPRADPSEPTRRARPPRRATLGLPTPRPRSSPFFVVAAQQSNQRPTGVHHVTPWLTACSADGGHRRRGGFGRRQADATQPPEGAGGRHAVLARRPRLDGPERQGKGGIHGGPDFSAARSRFARRGGVEGDAGAAALHPTGAVRRRARRRCKDATCYDRWPWREPA